MTFGVSRRLNREGSLFKFLGQKEGLIREGSLIERGLINNFGFEGRAYKRGSLIVRELNSAFTVP